MNDKLVVQEFGCVVRFTDVQEQLSESDTENSGYKRLRDSVLYTICDDEEPESLWLGPPDAVPYVEDWDPDFDPRTSFVLLEKDHDI